MHEEHGDLSKITELWFQNNFFSGTLPEWFNEITALRVLSFRFNKLTGKIPNYYMPNLRLFLLSDNELTGTIPPSVFLMPSLREFKITSNKMSGSIVVPENFEESLIQCKFCLIHLEILSLLIILLNNNFLKFG